MTHAEKLAAARAQLAAAEAVYEAARTPEALAEIAAATTANAETEREETIAGLALDDAERGAEDRLRLRVLRADSMVVWHPDLLAEFERATGIAYNDRRLIQPGNARRDVYGDALSAYVRRCIHADPERRAAEAALKATDANGNKARARLREARATLDRLAREVVSARSHVAALEAVPAVPTPDDKAERAERRQAGARAKRAREVLAKIEAGEIDPRGPQS
mgnify:FL=1